MSEPRLADASRERGACGIGDVLTAWRVLGVDSDEERAAIAHLLGFELTIPQTMAEKETDRPLDSISTPRPEPVPPPSPKPSASHRPAAPGAGGPTVVLMPMTPRPKVDLPVLPEPLKEGGSPRGHSSDQLVPARWARAWHTLLGRGVSDRGGLDVARVARRIARGEPVVRLPRMLRRVQKRRLCLYIEIGGHMAWLRDAATSLVAELRRVYDERVEVAWVDERPQRLEADGCGVRYLLVGTFGARVGWTPYDPVLGRAWVAFADSVRRAGGDAVALCPADAASARSLFGDRAPVVVWNDLASPSQAANAVRRLRST